MDPNNPDFLGLKNKVVIITGSSSGLGQNTAIALAAHGSKLVLTGRSEKGLERTVRDCKAAGLEEEKMIVVPGDITNEKTCQSIVDKAFEYFGRIDVLVNNAGAVSAGTFENCTLETLDSIFDINVFGLIKMTRATLPYLSGSKGCIVNVGSFTGHRPVNDYFAYCMSKTVVEHFTRCLALEVGATGVRVNSICPGILRDTNLWLRPGMGLAKNPLLGGFILKKIGPMYPLGRGSWSAEMVPSILFMISETCASFITGSSLLIDGGKNLTSAQP